MTTSSSGTTNHSNMSSKIGNICLMMFFCFISAWCLACFLRFNHISAPKELASKLPSSCCWKVGLALGTLNTLHRAAQGTTTSTVHAGRQGYPDTRFQKPSWAGRFDFWWYLLDIFGEDVFSELTFYIYTSTWYLQENHLIMRYILFIYIILYTRHPMRTEIRLPK